MEVRGGVSTSQSSTSQSSTSQSSTSLSLRLLSALCAREALFLITDKVDNLAAVTAADTDAAAARCGRAAAAAQAAVAAARCGHAAAAAAAVAAAAAATPLATTTAAARAWTSAQHTWRGRRGVACAVQNLQSRPSSPFRLAAMLRSADREWGCT